MAWRMWIAFAALGVALGTAIGTAIGVQAAPVALAPPPLPRLAAAPAGQGRIYRADAQLPPGYVEEEYLISGSGRLYGYDERGGVKVVAADVPWTSRIVVRRPADRAHFSGWMFVEPLHPELGTDFVWRSSREYFARKGDAWVGLTTVRGRILYGKGGPIAALKAFDPVRYAALGVGADGSEGGLDWDMLAALGVAAKAGKLTAGMPVRKTMLGGWSGAGALTLFFANSFAMRERLPGGAPIFDAILLGEPGWYPRITDAAGDIIAYDVRNAPAPLDVPVISLHSTAPIDFAMPFRTRPDSDAPLGRYRAYEIAGANHRGAREPMNGDLGALCGDASSDFPVHHFVSLTVDHLKHWADGGSPPPASQPIAIDAYGKPRVDRFGNVLGGVRSTILDVPVARHWQVHDAPLVECRGGARMRDFPRDRLVALYRDKAGYVARVEARAAALVRDRWLLPEEAAELVAGARGFRGFAMPAVATPARIND